ncbi:NUDIX hydrolase [candidate division KSB1 bacterium]|nr:NUDIX hydrolase [candidate division KSB1 bacterium]
MDEIPKAAVRVLIENNKKEILFLRRANTEFMKGYWCLPGGKVDFGRTLAETVDNEVKEETGLICTEQRFLFCWETLPTATLNTHYISLVFHCLTRGSIRLNSESDAHLWVGPDRIATLASAFENDKIAQKYWREYARLE